MTKLTRLLSQKNILAIYLQPEEQIQLYPIILT